jgi:hypothetical protein
VVKLNLNNDAEAEPFEHGWQCQTHLWPEDEFLRDAKPPFKIEHRFTRGPAIWSRWIDGHHVPFTHVEAMAIATAEAVAEVERAGGKAA